MIYFCVAAGGKFTRHRILGCGSSLEMIYPRYFCNYALINPRSLKKKKKKRFGDSKMLVSIFI